VTKLGNFEAIAAWETFGPHSGRPVQNIAVLAEGRRYGGFTSDEHARWFAERAGLTDPEILHYTGEPPCSTLSPPS
jgi:hypothetical protein